MQTKPQIPPLLITLKQLYHLHASIPINLLILNLLFGSRVLVLPSNLRERSILQMELVRTRCHPSRYFRFSIFSTFKKLGLRKSHCALLRGRKIWSLTEYS